MKKILLLLLSLGIAMPLASVNALVPNDTLFQNQWYLKQIDAPSAWDSETGSSNIVVAVLDTGVDLDHEDLESRIFINTGEIAGDGIDNDGNGFIDDVKGWDFFDNDSNANPEPNGSMSFGIHHGTVVAGLIGAAGNNATGISGVNWDVRILPIRVLDSNGDGDVSDIVEGINYAVDMGVDVINMSFVGDFSPKFMEEALQRAFDNNVVIVAAMGNLDNGGTNLDITPMYPVCSSGTGEDDIIIGVVATNSDDKKASFSNYGSDCADIAAPGQDIISTQVVTDIGAQKYTSGWQGTSLATPIISGTAALMRSAYPKSTPKEIMTAMQLSVDPIFGGAPSRAVGALGSGRINIARALEVLPKLMPESSLVVDEPLTVEPASTDSQNTALTAGVQPLVVGAGAGDSPLVTVFKSGKATSWNAYAEAFKGGVKVASGQLDNKAGYEIVTGAGAGGGPHIRVFDDSGNLKSQFFAFGQSFSGGVDVAVGDTDGDGIDEIIVVPGVGRKAVARAFSLNGDILFELDLENNGNAFNVSMGDMDGDGKDEIIVTEGLGGSPTVRVYNLATNLQTEFMVYGSNMLKGVLSAVVNFNGVSRIVSGTESGAGPQVRLFNRIGALAGQFFAYSEGDRNGADVVSWDYKNDGNDYIVTSGINNGLPVLRVYDTNSNQIDATLPLIGYTKRVSL